MIYARADNAVVIHEFFFSYLQEKRYKYLSE